METPSYRTPRIAREAVELGRFLIIGFAMAFATLEDFKAHARVDFDDDNELIESYLDAATDFLRGFLVDDPEADDPPSEPSHDLKQATLLIASSWYDRREASIDVTLREIPYGARDIINQIRSWNFG